MSKCRASSASFDIISADYYGNSYGVYQTAGYVFTPKINITVTSLGFFDYGEDGLGESHKVGIFENSSEALLTSAFVASGTSSPLIDNFRYTEITPLNLDAGKTYTIAALLLTQADVVGYASNTGFSVNPAISLLDPAARYNIPNGLDLEFPSDTALLARPMFFCPNFQLTAAPLPPTGWLLGSALLGLMGWRRFGKK